MARTLDPRTPIVEPYGWDWTATTHEGSAGIVDDLLSALGAKAVVAGKGLQGWSQSLAAYDAGGYKTGTIYFGGGRDDVHVVSTSHQAHEARSAVVDIGAARTSRVDTRMDTLKPFDELAALAHDVAGMKARVTWIESSLGGESTGRTIMVGSPSSQVRIRVYEKWLESPGLYVEGTNRVEVQFRPPSRGKAAVSTWTPAETFCASELSRRFAKALENEVAHPATVQKKKATPDLERSLGWMGHQYGATFARWMSHSGGDLGRVLDYFATFGVPEDLAR